MRRYHYLLLLGSFLLAAPLFGQIEALEQQLDTAQGTARVQLLNDLSMHYNNKLARYQPDKAKSFALEALALSQELAYEDGEAVSYYRLGNVYAGQKDVNQQLAQYEKWLQVRQAQGDPIKIGWALNELLFLYANMENETELLRHFKSLERLHRSEARSLLYHNSAQRLAHFYGKRKDWDNWLYYQKKAAECLLDTTAYHPGYTRKEDFIRAKAQHFANTFNPVWKLNQLYETDSVELEKRIRYSLEVLEVYGFADIQEEFMQLLFARAASSKMAYLADALGPRLIERFEESERRAEASHLQRLYGLHKKSMDAYSDALALFFEAYQNTKKAEQALAADAPSYLRLVAVAAAEQVYIQMRDQAVQDKREHRRVIQVLEKWQEEVAADNYAPGKAILDRSLEGQQALLDGL